MLIGFDYGMELNLNKSQLMDGYPVDFGTNLISYKPVSEMVSQIFRY
jgi:hypothetical protein